MPFSLSEIDSLFDPLLTVDASLDGGASIRVKFTEAFQSVSMLSDGLGVESSDPSITCRTSDVLSARHGNTVLVGDKTYYVKGIEPFGSGLTKLILSEDSPNV